MATKNKLSVYLVKEGITSANDIFEDPGKIRVLERYSENSAAYFVPHWPRTRTGSGISSYVVVMVCYYKQIQE